MPHEDSPGAAEEFGSLLFSVLSFRVYATAVRLGIPEAIGEEVRTGAEIAAAT
ncbi:hypothetical protein G3I76_60015, partial [Streptomyces sp. SID11233]|nr:hypothetical protein [Streptomyces sp. SID11233]